MGEGAEDGQEQEFLEHVVKVGLKRGRCNLLANDEFAADEWIGAD